MGVFKEPGKKQVWKSGKKNGVPPPPPPRGFGVFLKQEKKKGDKGSPNLGPGAHRTVGLGPFGKKKKMPGGWAPPPHPLSLLRLPGFPPNGPKFR